MSTPRRSASPYGLGSAAGAAAGRNGPPEELTELGELPSVVLSLMTLGVALVLKRSVAQHIAEQRGGFEAGG